MFAPECPEWARDPQYADLDPVTALEIRRGFIDQRTLNARISRRKYAAKRSVRRMPADRRLAKLKAHVTMWRNHIARAESRAPGSIAAIQTALSIHSYRAKLAEAEQELRRYVESALRTELARDE